MRDNVPNPGKLCICRGQVALYSTDNSEPAVLRIYTGEILLSLGPVGKLWHQVLYQEKVWEVDVLAFNSGYIAQCQ